MKASELRIGNFVLVNYKTDLTSKVRMVCDESCEVMFDSQPDLVNGAVVSPSKLSGIPLTEDWLLRFGFEKRALYGWKGNRADWQPETSKTEYQDFVKWIDSYAFVFRFDTAFWRKDETENWNSQTNVSVHLAAQYYENLNENIPLLPPLEYAHQLQNLFFCLCGTELELKAVTV